MKGQRMVRPERFSRCSSLLKPAPPFIAIRLGRWELSVWRKLHLHRTGYDLSHGRWSLVTTRQASGRLCDAALSLPFVVLFLTDKTS